MPNAVPEADLTSAKVGSFGTPIRYWADEPSGAFVERERKTIATVRANYGDSLRGKRFPINYLSISGGGADGAYGAGFLTGWTKRGDRPKFNVVTGISTGSMIAPLAFLGPKYDPMLKEAYTTVGTKDIASLQVLSALLGRSTGLTDNAGLKRLVQRYLTQEMLDEIAVESRKGRALLIGTTLLEGERPVIWDIGAIAETGNPQALGLVHDIILASAAIPGAFPAVNISVTVAGKTYTETHVDGGVTRQVFMYPASYRPKEVDKVIGWKPQRTVYIIRNSKVVPEYTPIRASIFPIVGRSVSTLIKSDGIGDLHRIYVVAQRDGVRYNVTAVPKTFTLKSKSAFDKDYMTALFDAGYEAALAPSPWKNVPPDLE